MLDPDTLIQRYLEGTLTETQAEQLHELLEAQPDLGEKLLQHLEIDAMLHAAKPLAASPIIRSVFPPKRRVTFATAAALAACMALLATWILVSRQNPDREPTTASVALLARGLNLDWESAAITPGTPLSPGLLKLRSGFAKIEFYQGASVILEGPAEFQLISGSEATCTLGKLTATVPPQAIGFRINTPKGSIVDLGTEFGLDVNAIRSEVHVFKGEVALHKPGESIKLIKEGQAMSFAANSQLLAANPSGFVSLSEIDTRALISDRSRFERWQTQSGKWKSDPSLKHYFDFQDGKAARSLHNHAPHGEDGSIVGTAWTEGRWPGKGAIDFRNASDRVRLSVPFETETLTMAVSVRVNTLNPQFNSLLVSDGWGQHKMHWQILANGKVRLAVGIPRGWGKAYEYDTPVYFTSERLGSWVHLAVVVDPAANEVRHYVNGTVLVHLPLASSVSMKIGNAELGNWNKANNTSTIHTCHLNGAVDEFALWDRALSDAEIAALTK
ncbi:MAG: LamG-like jellyroll fold domain-containing protein [Luteolibacter sp.]